MQDSVDAALLKEMNVKGEIKNCIVEGPISYDLIMSRESARIKGYESPVSGDADIIIVPNITVGNVPASTCPWFCLHRQQRRQAEGQGVRGQDGLVHYRRVLLAKDTVFRVDPFHTFVLLAGEYRVLAYAFASILLGVFVAASKRSRAKDGVELAAL